MKETTENVVEKLVEIPRSIYIEKLESQVIEYPKIVELNKTVIVPVEKPIEVDRIVQKVVHIESEKEGGGD